MGIMTYVGRQFRKPTGLFGKLLAIIMNHQNDTLYRGVESNLNIRDNDVILEIGFGNGCLMNRLAGKHPGAFHGIDISQDMLQAAQSRNAALIQQGRVLLKLGDVMRTGYPDRSFDKVYTINTVYFWQDLQKGLEEIARVLKPGGVFINGGYTKECLESLPATKQGFNKYTHAQLVDAGRLTGLVVQSSQSLTHNSYCLIYSKPA